jgi:hypothetical protein
MLRGAPGGVEGAALLLLALALVGASQELEIAARRVLRTSGSFSVSYTESDAVALKTASGPTGAIEIAQNPVVILRAVSQAKLRRVTRNSERQI